MRRAIHVTTRIRWGSAVVNTVLCTVFCAVLSFGPFALGQAKLESSARSETAKSLASVSSTSPKTVYVVVSKAAVHSGPATETYPTTNLGQGTALEVYHRTDDGWLGIRPPENSFSWVPAPDAYLLPGGRVIEITSSNSVSWIGTELGSAKQYRWQVKLNSGEQLGVLGEMTVKDDEGRETLWYKVAPPAGEFRWIHEKAISIQPPAKVSTAATQREGKPASAVVAASAQSQQSNAIQQADYTEDVFAEGAVIEDQYIDGQYVDGEYIVGDYVEGGYIEGEYIDEGYVIDNGYVDGLPVRSANSWDGWHALELTDEGFRSPFLERRYRESRARAASDPLNYDPFDLSMAKRGPVAPQSMRAVVRQDHGISQTRRNTSWRDPRTLRDKRLQGYPMDSLTSRIDEPTGSQLAARSVEMPKPPGETVTDLFSRLASSTAKLAGGADSSADAMRDQRADIGAIPGSLASTSLNSSANNRSDSWYGLQDQASSVASAVASQVSNVGAAELNQVQLVLSEMVAKPMQFWNLPPLIRQTQFLIEHGASPLERGQARLLLERIQEFELLASKSGYGSNVLMASAAGANSGSVPTTTAGYQTPATSSSNGEYDATGWLVPVHTTATSQPSHAITNDSGQIIAYVSGLPGMNLERYVNHPVGISGLRGYLPQLKANHIQAQRVVQLR